MGQPLFALHADDHAHLNLGREAISGSVVIGDEPPAVVGSQYELVRA
jgi:hypothetical protein